MCLTDTWMTQCGPTETILFLSLCPVLTWPQSASTGLNCFPSWMSVCVSESHPSLHQCGVEQTIIELSKHFFELSLKILHVACLILLNMLYTLSLFVRTLHPILENIWNKCFCVFSFIFVYKIHSMFLFRVRVETFHKHLKSWREEKMFLSLAGIVGHMRWANINSELDECLQWGDKVLFVVAFPFFTVSLQLSPGCQWSPLNNITVTSQLVSCVWLK